VTASQPKPAKAEKAAASPARKLLLLLLRIAISGGLLWLAFRNVKWTILIASLRHMNGLWFMAAFLCLALQIALAGLRWRLIVHACGLPLTARAAVRYTYIATFFNQTLPASVGGDAARIWLLNRSHGNWKAPLYSVVIDRSIGGIALALLVLACLPVAFTLIPGQAGRIALLTVGLCCLAVFVLVLSVGALPWAWIDRWTATRQARAVAQISGRLFLFSVAGSAVVAMSIFIHILSAVAVWLIAHALSAPLPLTAALALVPLIMLIAMAPVSIAGWGVRESATVAILAYAGVGNSDGFLISVLFGAAAVFIGIIGGVLWILSGNAGRTPPSLEGAAG